MRRFQIGDAVFDPNNGRLVVNGEETVLPALSARALMLLIKHAPEPVSLEVFTQEAWGRNHVSEETLAQRIAMLRRAFNDDPRTPRYIRTDRGRGYALVAPVRAILLPFPVVRAAMLAGFAALITLIGVVWISASLGDSPEPVTLAEAGDEVDAMLTRAREQLAVHQPAETARAILLLEDAILRSPERQDVAVALSFALSTAATKFDGVEASLERAEGLARSVTVSAPNVSNGWHALGYALDGQGRVDEALAAYQRALALNPDDSNAASSAAYLMGVRGRLYDALRHEMNAYQPLSASRYAELQIARSLALLGREPLANLWMDRALRLNPGHPVIIAGAVEIALSQGRLGEAQVLLEFHQETTPELERLRGRLALLNGDAESASEHFIAAGDAASWERAAMQAQHTGSAPPPDFGGSSVTWPGAFFAAAEVAAAWKDEEAAASHLQRAVDLGWRDADAIRVSPWLSHLETDDAVEAAIGRIEAQISAQNAILEADQNLQTFLASPLMSEDR